MYRKAIIGFAVGTTLFAASAHAATYTCDPLVPNSTGTVGVQVCRGVLSSLGDGQCEGWLSTSVSASYGFTQAAIVMRSFEVPSTADGNVNRFAVKNDLFGFFPPSAAVIHNTVFFQSAASGNPNISATVDFAVIYTTGAGILKTNTTSCSGSGTCSNAATTISGATGAGLTFGGVVLNSFDLQVTSPSLTLSLGASTGSVSVGATDVTYDAGCRFTGTPSAMGCDVTAVSFAYTSNVYSATKAWTDSVFDDFQSSDLVASAAMTGAFMAMNAWSLSFSLGPHDLWKVRAGYPEMVDTGLNVFATRWGSFADTYPLTATSAYQVHNEGYLFGMQ